MKIYEQIHYILHVFEVIVIAPCENIINFKSASLSDYLIYKTSSVQHAEPIGRIFLGVTLFHAVISLVFYTAFTEGVMISRHCTVYS